MAEDLESFRLRLREWLSAHAAEHVHSTDSNAVIEAGKRFARRLFDAGYAGLSWPTAYGGQGLGPAEERVFEEEASRFSLPTGIYDIGLGMCGPIILRLGTDAQRERYIRPLLEGTEIWCQLFSEPAAGSDLAGLRTNAVSSGDGFIVNGQKVWTTGAHLSDFGILLARTDLDARKHRGITMFIIDMHAPGVEVRPLIDITGEVHFNEVFLDDVHLAADSVVGQLNRGWDAARILLSLERLAVGGGAGAEGHTAGPLSFDGLRAAARSTGSIADPLVQDALIDVYLMERSVEALNDRLARDASTGIDLGARGSIGKVLTARREMRAADLATRIAGPQIVDDDEWAELRRASLRSVSFALGGGTNEIQLSIIGEQVLGLPREPQSDLAMPFRDIHMSGPQT